MCASDTMRIKKTYRIKLLIDGCFLLHGGELHLHATHAGHRTAHVRVQLRDADVDASGEAIKMRLSRFY